MAHLNLCQIERLAAPQNGARRYPPMTPDLETQIVFVFRKWAKAKVHGMPTADDAAVFCMEVIHPTGLCDWPTLHALLREKGLLSGDEPDLTRAFGRVHGKGDIYKE